MSAGGNEVGFDFLTSFSSGCFAAKTMTMSWMDLATNSTLSKPRAMSGKRAVPFQPKPERFLSISKEIGMFTGVVTVSFSLSYYTGKIIWPVDLVRMVFDVVIVVYCH